MKGTSGAVDVTGCLIRLFQSGNLQTYALYGNRVTGHPRLDTFLTMSPLTYIMGLPLAMALILAVVPSEKRQFFRWGARMATLGSLLLAIYVFSAFDPPITDQPAHYRLKAPRNLLWRTSTVINSLSVWNGFRR